MCHVIPLIMMSDLIVVCHFTIVIHRLILHSCRHYLSYVFRISFSIPPYLGVGARIIVAIGIV